MDKLLLSNGEYYQNMSNSFKTLLSDQNFSDVTLVCEGYKQVKAHKFILSAHSPVFNEMLLNNPHQHPLVYLSGIIHEDLQALVRFLYLGETKVNQERFSSFLKFSKEFQIEGLANLASENQLVNNVDKHKEVTKALEKGQYTEDIIELIEDTNNELGTSELMVEDSYYMTENILELEERPFEMDQSRSEIEESLPSIEQFLNNLNETYEADLQEVKSEMVESIVSIKPSIVSEVPKERTRVNILSCNQCDHTTNSEVDLNIHKTSAHSEKLYPCADCKKRMDSEEGIFYPCTSCTLNLVKEKKKEKVMKFKCDKCDYKAGKINHLTQHKQSKHMNVVYSCDKCDYKASIKGNLSQHKQAEHEGIRYSCKVCGYEAKKMGHLMQHKKVKHMSF